MRRKWQPTPVFWPGEFHGLYSPQNHKESDTTEQLSLTHLLTQQLSTAQHTHSGNKIEEILGEHDLFWFKEPFEKNLIKLWPFYPENAHPLSNFLKISNFIGYW